MVHTIWKKLTGFRQDAQGVVLILTALLILPFIILLGVAVDVGHLLVVKNQLIAALDAAALSAAKNPSFDDAQARAQVQAFINANFSSQNQISVSALTINRVNNNTKVDVTATATVNTYFAEIIGYNTLSTTIHSQALGALNHLEVVLVLDNTGSMETVYGGSRGIDGLKTAATTLVNTLFAADPSGTNIKIGIVPFTDTVNVGAQYANEAWIDNANAAGSMSQENIDVPAGTGLITFASNLATAASQSSWAWAGCVRQRTEPYDVQDVAPSNPATLFTPFFAPDEPDRDSSLASGNHVCGGGSDLWNSYLCDKSCWQTNQQADQKCIAKYTTSPQIQDSRNGPNSLCTIQPIIRLTNDQSALLSEINAMTAYGATVVPVGLMWGWHLLSPNGPFADGVSYANATTIKAIILVTDGQNDVQLHGRGESPTASTNGFNKSIYSAYGYGSGPHLNQLSLPSASDGVIDQADYNLNQKLITLCNNIKAVTDANGNTGRIQIYSIGFGNVLDSSALQLLQQCATSPSNYYYNPTGEELDTTFRNIALGLNKLRLSQ